MNDDVVRAACENPRINQHSWRSSLEVVILKGEPSWFKWIWHVIANNHRRPFFQKILDIHFSNIFDIHFFKSTTSIFEKSSTSIFNNHRRPFSKNLRRLFSKIFDVHFSKNLRRPFFQKIFDIHFQIFSTFVCSYLRRLFSKNLRHLHPRAKLTGQTFQEKMLQSFWFWFHDIHSMGKGSKGRKCKLAWSDLIWPWYLIWIGRRADLDLFDAAFDLKIFFLEP